MRWRWKIGVVLGVLAAFVLGVVAGYQGTGWLYQRHFREGFWDCVEALGDTLYPLELVLRPDAPDDADILDLLAQPDSEAAAAMSDLHWWCPHCGAPYLVLRTAGMWRASVSTEEPVLVCTGWHRVWEPTDIRVAMKRAGGYTQLDDAQFAQLIMSGRYRMLAEGYRPPPPAERAKKPGAGAK